MSGKLVGGDVRGSFHAMRILIALLLVVAAPASAATITLSVEGHEHAEQSN